MNNKAFPVIDQTATGRNIRRLRIEQGLTVRDLQDFFGFEEPQAIYKWQRGESLPSVDNLYALGSLLEVPIEQILIQKNVPLKINEQQEKACCSDRFCELLLCFPGRQRARQKSESFSHFAMKSLLCGKDVSVRPALSAPAARRSDMEVSFPARLFRALGYTVIKTCLQNPVFWRVRF